MNRKVVSLGVSLMTFACIASAEVIVLDFEGVGDLASVDDFYNGGTDSQGNAGVNHGIAFTSASLAITDGDTKGLPFNGNFANEPSPDTVLFFLSGDAATMNIDAGFDTGFSFFYTTNFDTGFVRVYDELNGVGNILAQLDLSVNWQDNGCVGDPTGQFCNWDPIGVSFDGIARSVDFGGTLNQVGFDDITLGSAIAGGGDVLTVPTPGVPALLGAGFIGLVWSRRKGRPAIQQLQRIGN